MVMIWKKKGCQMSRSRKGAWIEMLKRSSTHKMYYCRSRKGAWIEIVSCSNTLRQSGSRSRKGAWIEIPTLERLWPYGYKSLPQGSVD